MVPQVVQIKLQAAKMAPEGAQRCPNSLEVLLNTSKINTKGVDWEARGLLGKYIAAMLGTWEFEKWRAFRVVFE